MNEYEVGEEFKVDGEKYRCIDNNFHSDGVNYCKKCDFYKKSSGFCDNMNCAASDRADGKDVFFKKVISHNNTSSGYKKQHPVKLHTKGETI